MSGGREVEQGGESEEDPQEVWQKVLQVGAGAEKGVQQLVERR